MDFPGAQGQKFSVHMYRPYVEFRTDAAKVLSQMDPSRRGDSMLCCRASFMEELPQKLAGKIIKKKVQVLSLGGAAYESRLAAAAASGSNETVMATKHDDEKLDDPFMSFALFPDMASGKVKYLKHLVK